MLVIAQCDSEDLIFLNPGKGGNILKKGTAYNVQELTTERIRTGIMFAHAFSGCDSTSAIFGMGKLSLWALVQSSDELQDICGIFNSRNASHNDIFQTGWKTFLILYGAKEEGISLKEHRISLFEKTALRKGCDLRTLCAT